MRDLLRMFSGMTRDMMNYDSRKIARDYVNGLVVSTCYASDIDGFETAILDTEKTYPVERYSDAEAARVGHARWVVKAVTLTEVTRLGYGDLIPDEVFTLKRG